MKVDAKLLNDMLDGFKAFAIDSVNEGHAEGYKSYQALLEGFMAVYADSDDIQMIDEYDGIPAGEGGK